MIRVCPLCGNSLIRVPRRAVDRLTSILRPVWRYRCTKLTCTWIGNLPMEPPPPPEWDHTDIGRPG